MMAFGKSPDPNHVSDVMAEALGCLRRVVDHVGSVRSANLQVARLIRDSFVPRMKMKQRMASLEMSTPCWTRSIGPPILGV